MGLGVTVGLGVLVGVRVIVTVALGLLVEVDVGCAADVLQAKETSIKMEKNNNTGFDFWGFIDPPLFRIKP